MYGLTFVSAVTINWAIPHVIPGDPIGSLMRDRFLTQPDPTSYDVLFHSFARGFRPDLPLWKQYLYYWDSLFHFDLGISITMYPSTVFDVIMRSAPYTLGLIVPAVALSWFVGNKIGAMAAHARLLDSTVLPASYVLSASPYMWTAALVAWLLAFRWRLFPGSGAYEPTVIQDWSWHFATDLLNHWFLPFLSLFVVAFGTWAIGMRNAIIPELDSDYVRYLEALGAPRRLIRKYTYRNAILPQITGLALQLGVVMGGAVVTEVIFTYPGLGYLIYRGMMTRDLFLVQGIFLFIIIGVLVMNFLVDLVCVLVDPRTRVGMQGGQA